MSIVAPGRGEVPTTVTTGMPPAAPTPSALDGKEYVINSAVAQPHRIERGRTTGLAVCAKEIGIFSRWAALTRHGFIVFPCGAAGRSCQDSYGTVMPDPGKVRIMLVDDHAVVRAGYRRFLETEPDYEV